MYVSLENRIQTTQHYQREMRIHIASVVGTITAFADYLPAQTQTIERFESDFTAANKYCDQGCLLWYDGCNFCKCSNGRTTSCSQQKCSFRQRRTCVISSQESACPIKNCRLFWDGCDDCICYSDNSAKCSRRDCEDIDEPRCKVFGPPLQNPDKGRCPLFCNVYWNGCNFCRCDEGRITGCTSEVCMNRSTPICVDSESKDGQRDPRCPSNCSIFYDGCNICRCEEGKETVCTEMECTTVSHPQCLETTDWSEEFEEIEYVEPINITPVLSNISSAFHPLRRP